MLGIKLIPNKDAFSLWNQILIGLPNNILVYSIHIQSRQHKKVTHYTIQ